MSLDSVEEFLRENWVGESKSPLKKVGLIVRTLSDPSLLHQRKTGQVLSRLMPKSGLFWGLPWPVLVVKWAEIKVPSIV